MDPRENSDRSRAYLFPMASTCDSTFLWLKKAMWLIRGVDSAPTHPREEKRAIYPLVIEGLFKISVGSSFIGRSFHEGLPKIDLELKCGSMVKDGFRHSSISKVDLSSGSERVFLSIVQSPGRRKAKRDSSIAFHEKVFLLFLLCLT